MVAVRQDTAQTDFRDLSWRNALASLCMAQLSAVSNPANAHQVAQHAIIMTDALIAALTIHPSPHPAPYSQP